MEQKTSEAAIKNILNDPSASYWLKNAIKQLKQRDSVDAMHDINRLKDIWKYINEDN